MRNFRDVLAFSGFNFTLNKRKMCDKIVTKESNYSCHYFPFQGYLCVS